MQTYRLIHGAACGIWALIFVAILLPLSFAETILLKFGKQIDAKIVEKTDKNIKVDFQGVTITYGLDEVDQIIDEKLKDAPAPQFDSSAGIGSDLYSRAREHFAENKDYEINSVLNAPNRDPEKIKAVFAGNEEAMKLFKKAVLQTSDGTLFLKPGGDSGEFTRQSFTNLKIMTLVLLEAVQSVKSGQLALAEVYYTIMTELTNLIATTAVQLYQLDNQKLPDALEDLVPKYLAKIPEDPFNSFKPLQYLKTQDGYLIYGFGLDRIDQKGKVAFDLQDTSGKAQEGDIVLSIKAVNSTEEKPQ